MPSLHRQRTLINGRPPTARGNFDILSTRQDRSSVDLLCATIAAAKCPANPLVPSSRLAKPLVPLSAIVYPSTRTTSTSASTSNATVLRWPQLSRCSSTLVSSSSRTWGVSSSTLALTAGMLRFLSRVPAMLVSARSGRDQSTVSFRRICSCTSSQELLPHWQRRKRRQAKNQSFRHLQGSYARSPQHCETCRLSSTMNVAKSDSRAGLGW